MTGKSSIWSLGAAAAVLVGSFGMSALGQSGSISVAADANYGQYGGGEFVVTNFTGGLALAPMGSNGTGNVKVSGSTFQTFCIQADKDINANVSYTWTLSDKIDGITSLDPKAAYLYSNFWAGTLPNYNLAPGTTRVASARSLQLAMWSIMGQLGATENNPAYGSLSAEFAADGQANAWVTLATTANPANIGDVRVLVITDNTTGNFQDLLVKIAPSSGPSLTLDKIATYPANDPVHPAVGGVNVPITTPISPFQPVVYAYVLTNTGNVTLSGITVSDDAGTPGDPSDDFTLTPPAGTTLAPQASLTLYTAPTILPIKMCEPLPPSGVDTQVGVMYVSTVPPGDPINPHAGDLRIKYVQSYAANDNTYGTNTSPGWAANGHSHTFSNLTGSDGCEFLFRNNSGTELLDVNEDYISQVSPATAQFPSGWGTYGVLGGGEGKVIFGSGASVTGADTSLSRSFNFNPTYGTLYSTNSPAETSPGSGVTSVPGWDIINWYQIDIDKSLFGGVGLPTFGSVEIVKVHNSPPKEGSDNAFYPKPCGDTITNTATATATWFDGTSNQTITATPDSATVDIIGASSGGGGGGSTVTSTVQPISGKTLKVTLKNTATTTTTLQGIHLNWPGSDGNLLSAQVQAPKIYQPAAPGTPGPHVDITSFSGTLANRQIGAGKSVTLQFNFAATANTIKANYKLSLDFTGGTTVTVLP